ncbi:pseudouridine synthase family protein [Candidatus Reidiella endopervernicosa]|nr:RNA pseudouridine synthase [Candidatus Reidiella endopervernicosa]
MSKGAVWLTHDEHTARLRRAKRKPLAGDTLHLYYDEQVLAEEPTPPTLVADEGDYSVWYKPYGMRSQGSKYGDHCTINRWVEQNLEPERPAFIVHRLDRAATGLIIIAHKKRVAAEFTRMFQQRSIDKRYRVTVHGEFPDTPEPQLIEREIEGRSARSLITKLAFNGEQNRTHLDVSIETGRKHQIRRHLAEAGFPVVGDRLYGQKGDSEDLCLTAYQLTFACPVTHWRKSFNLPDSLPSNS